MVEEVSVHTIHNEDNNEQRLVMAYCFANAGMKEYQKGGEELAQKSVTSEMKRTKNATKTSSAFSMQPEPEVMLYLSIHKHVELHSYVQ